MVVVLWTCHSAYVFIGCCLVEIRSIDYGGAHTKKWFMSYFLLLMKRLVMLLKIKVIYTELVYCNEQNLTCKDQQTLIEKIFTMEV